MITTTQKLERISITTSFRAEHDQALEDLTQRGYEIRSSGVSRYVHNGAHKEATPEEYQIVAEKDLP